MKKIFISLTLISMLGGDYFQFIVFGDNQGYSPFFVKVIEEINILKPDFVISTCDMIQGYFEDTLKIKNAWKEFKKEIEKLKISFYPVPGNRDIWDKNSRKMYEREWGRSYYSFVYKNSLFIVLDTEEESKRENSIKGRQLKWLREELERNKSIRHKFIFLHRPLWLYGNANWMEKIHSLLLKYNVEAVFAGHVHIYCFDEIDGIKYIITGGAGKHLSLEEEKGGFNHYILVGVKGNSAHIYIIKPNSILPEDVILFERVKKDVKKVLK